MILQILLASKVKGIVKKKWPLSTHGSFFSLDTTSNKFYTYFLTWM